MNNDSTPPATESVGALLVRGVRPLVDCATVGDTIECDVRHPVPHTIRMTLETREAAAYANHLLMDKTSGWRMPTRRDCGACRHLNHGGIGCARPSCHGRIDWEPAVAA